ncbi:glycoside hydrolase [Nocardia sp. NPDC050406]|uniref:glycoside hydrolase n=1 Tax=Nocardia sp. NPDC050406 TaxID=3364318 RepID=UPI0037BA4FE3
MTPARVSRRSALGLAAGLSLSLLIPGRAAADPRISGLRYTLTSFTNDSETDLYVYESGDATNFQLLRAQAYTPPGGLLRDPSMFRHVDGSYYLTYTTGWEGHTIGFARSTDRLTWTHLYDYDVPMPDIVNCWAPEWFIAPDGRVGVIVSLYHDHRFTPYLMTATDTSLRTWTPLARLAGLAPPPDDTESDGYIDTTVIVHNGRFYAFTKQESTKFVELAVADEPTGPYSFIGTGDWAGWGGPREGQSVTRLPDGGWRIFLDAYLEGKYYYSDSYDDFATWTPPRELPGLSGIVRHGTIFIENDGPATTPHPA